MSNRQKSFFDQDTKVSISLLLYLLCGLETDYSIASSNLAWKLDRK